MWLGGSLFSSLLYLAMLPSHRQVYSGADGGVKGERQLRPKGKMVCRLSNMNEMGHHVYNGILLSHKKESDTAICSHLMNLEIVILSEVRQRKTNTMWYCLYVESKKKMAQMNLFTKQSQRCRKQTWLPREKGEGRDKLGVGDWCTLTITYKIDN